MAKSRTTKKVVSNVTGELYEESLAMYAAADAREQKLAAMMDEQITRIRDKYADDLNRCKETKDTSFEVVQRYCEENYNQLFDRKKSVETVHGLIGFRTGTPKLKNRKGFTWASVLELLKIKAPEYVRTKEEPNKELLLVDREKPELVALMPSIGIEVAQDETFFIDLKKEEVALT